MQLQYVLQLHRKHASPLLHLRGGTGNRRLDVRTIGRKLDLEHRTVTEQQLLVSGVGRDIQAHAPAGAQGTDGEERHFGDQLHVQVDLQPCD